MSQRDRQALYYLENWNLMQFLASLLPARFWRIPRAHQLKFFKGAAAFVALPMLGLVLVFLAWVPAFKTHFLALPILFTSPLLWWVAKWRVYVKAQPLE